MARPWLALAVLSTFLAGCIGGGSGSGDRGATMGDLLPAATLAARSWDPGAQFFLAVGWELGNVSDERVNERNFTVPSDARVGDGRGLTWLYGFFDSASSALFFVAVAAENESVVFRHAVGEPAGESSDAAPQWRTGEWKVDSDDALDAAQANATFAEVEAKLAEPAYVYTLVGTPSPERAAVWALLAMDLPEMERISAMEEDGDLDPEEVDEYLDTIPIAVAAVDAVSGEVLEAGAFSDVTPEAPEEPVQPSVPTDPHAGHNMGPRTILKMEESGTLTLLEDSATFDLPIAEEGVTLEGNFTYGLGAVPGGATMIIENAAGERVYSSGGAGLVLKETRNGIFVEDVPAGDYTITIGLDNFSPRAEWKFDLRVIATGMPINATATPPEEPEEPEPPEDPTVLVGLLAAIARAAAS